jgi:putative transposase
MFVEIQLQNTAPDENAAKNINKVGIEHGHDSKWTQRDSKTTSVASFVEASRITVAPAR